MRLEILVKNLLINLLFILLPLFLLQTVQLMVYLHRCCWLKKWMIYLLPILSVTLCMLNPFVIDEVYIFDLRYIPFVISFFYLGWRMGAVLIVYMICLRTVISYDLGVQISLLSLLILTLVIAFLYRHFRRATRSKKLLISIGLGAFSALTALLLSANMRGLEPNISIWSVYIVVNIAGMAITCALVEVILTNDRLLHQVAKAERLEIVSHLAASISHEVRNPLTVSKGFMQLLLQQDVSPETKQRYLDISISELDRATDIINDYLTFARSKSDQIDNICLFKEIEQVVKILSPMANMSGVIFEVTKEEEEHFIVLGERKKIQQCLINILKNGIEAMPDGGHLKIHMSRNDANVQIDIRDTGSGMTQEQLNRLGEPYYSVKENGTGLGMMVSYSIIKGMNGKMYVSSELKKGTCFSMVLPLCS